jgi:hypothetical protein
MSKSQNQEWAEAIHAKAQAFELENMAELDEDDILQELIGDLAQALKGGTEQDTVEQAERTRGYLLEAGYADADELAGRPE